MMIRIEIIFVFFLFYQKIRLFDSEKVYEQEKLKRLFVERKFSNNAIGVTFHQIPQSEDLSSQITLIFVLPFQVLTGQIINEPCCKEKQTFLVKLKSIIILDRSYMIIRSYVIVFAFKNYLFNALDYCELGLECIFSYQYLVSKM